MNVWLKLIACSFSPAVKYYQCGSWQADNDKQKYCITAVALNKITLALDLSKRWSNQYLQKNYGKVLGQPTWEVL